MDVGSVELSSALPDWELADFEACSDLANPKDEEAEYVRSISMLQSIGIVALADWIFSNCTDFSHEFSVSIHCFRNQVWRDDYLVNEYSVETPVNAVDFITDGRRLTLICDSTVVVQVSATKDYRSFASDVKSVVEKLNKDLNVELKYSTPHIRNVDLPSASARDDRQFVTLPFESEGSAVGMPDWVLRVCSGSAREVASRLESYFPRDEASPATGIAHLRNLLRSFYPEAICLSRGRAQIVCRSKTSAVFRTENKTERQAMSMAERLLDSGHSEIEVLRDLILLLGGLQANPYPLSGFFFENFDTGFPIALDAGMWKQVTQRSNPEAKWRSSSAVFCSVSGNWLQICSDGSSGWILHDEYRIVPFAGNVSELVDKIALVLNRSGTLNFDYQL